MTVLTPLPPTVHKTKDEQHHVSGFSQHVDHHLGIGGDGLVAVMLVQVLPVPSSVVFQQPCHLYLAMPQGPFSTTLAGLSSSPNSALP